MAKKAACIAVLGTGSDVGKSIVTTALCRILADYGWRVAPFKAQNMSNNSGVTPEGLEMGRAQIVQAEAARIVPHVDMNPVLLKPTSDVGSQIVLNGKAWLDASSKSYYQKKEILWTETCRALERLRSCFDIVVMEGAGSCAEVNLMDNDIVNLKAAASVDAPVILVADIDRGGVFAQLIGTLACLAPDHQDRIKGFVINRFRGDIDLFKDGVKWIEQKTERPVFGVLPWFNHFNIEAEDAVVIENIQPFDPSQTNLSAIAVIRLPHISNFNDFDPLAAVKGLQLVYIKTFQSLAAFQAVIIPGSKSTRNDLEWLHHTGLTRALKAFVKRGGYLLGVCGGYQMLGERVLDPDGVEGFPGETPGLGLLPVETELKAPKITTRTIFSWDGLQGAGYEIHMGQTRRLKGSPMMKVHRRNQKTCEDSDGCLSPDGRVMGTYIHGLFDTPAITHRWLSQIGVTGLAVDQIHGPMARDCAYQKLASFESPLINRVYQKLAEHATRHIDVPAILKLLPPWFQIPGDQKQNRQDQ